MKSNEMWQRYAGDHADQITYEAWAFCGGGKVGDRSLSYWRRVHREAFKPEYLAAGKDFDERDLCVLEEFELVYPVEDHADK